MQYTMSMYKSKYDMQADMRAKLTNLRAELEQERELSDRLAECAEDAMAYAKALADVDGGIDNCDIEYRADYERAVKALIAHSTRRNK